MLSGPLDPCLKDYADITPKSRLANGDYLCKPSLMIEQPKPLATIQLSEEQTTRLSNHPDLTVQSPFSNHPAIYTCPADTVDHCPPSTAINYWQCGWRCPESVVNIYCSCCCKPGCPKASKATFYWKQVSGIKYNVASYEYSASTGFTDTQTAGVSTEIGGSISTNLETTVAGVKGVVSGEVGASLAAELKHTIETTTTSTITEDCNPNGIYTTYGGHRIVGWAVFQFTAQIQNLAGCYKDVDVNTRYTTCQPVVEGKVLTPKCFPREAQGTFMQFCSDEADQFTKTCNG